MLRFLGTIFLCLLPIATYFCGVIDGIRYAAKALHQ